MRVLRELVSAAVCPERVLRGPGPPALLRSQFPWIEALRVTSMVPCIKVPRWSFSLARKHLLDSFPYFLWAQGHYHLSHRGSLQLSTEGHPEELHHAAMLGAFQTF